MEKTGLVLTADYHTHTPYSHGANTIAENVARAKEIGLQQIGISDHGYSHIIYGLRRKETKKYIAECKKAEEEYGIKVLVGIEANIRSVSGIADLTKADYENFDVYLCGHHIYVQYVKTRELWCYGYGNWVRSSLLKKEPTQKQLERNTKAYVNVIKNNPIDAVTHVGYLCPANAVEVAKCASDYGTYIELNSKKTHFTDEELNDIVAKTPARFIINSDAHSASRVGDTKLVEEQLSRIRFPMDRIDNINGRLPNFRFADFKKRM